MPVDKEPLAVLPNPTGRTAEAARFGPEGALPLMVGFVHPGSYRHEFAWSLLKQLMNLHQRVTVLPVRSGPNISNPRNDVISAFLQSDCAWFLFVDTDIEWEPEHVDTLLEHAITGDYPILGGVYKNRFLAEEEPEIVCTYHLGDGKYGHGEVLPQTEGIVEVAGLGMGFTLIRRDVAEALGKPGGLWPFAEMLVRGASVGAVSEESKAVNHMLSEDVAFCFRAKAKGFDSYLDLDVRVKHHKSTVYE